MCANVVFEKLDVTAHIFLAHATEIIGCESLKDQFSAARRFICECCVGHLRAVLSPEILLLLLHFPAFLT